MLPQTPAVIEDNDWLIPPDDGCIGCGEADLDTLADVLAAILARLLRESEAGHHAGSPEPALPSQEPSASD